MSIDLTAARAAAFDALFDYFDEESMPDTGEAAAVAVNAAAPLIEQAVREQIARDIEAEAAKLRLTRGAYAPDSVTARLVTAATSAARISAQISRVGIR